MDSFYVKLPKWKAYLYSLLQRIRLYKAINSNRHRWNLNRKEVLLLRQMQSKYLTKGVMRKPKAFRYQSLIQNVLIDNVTVATKAEIELAQKFLIVNNLNLEELIMEMKDLKKFAKEVGIKDADVKKMDEATLTREIIARVEPQQEYSKELVAFYNDLPDDYFDEAEATGGATQSDSKTAGEYSIDDVVEVINEYTKVAELKEILADDDVGPMFKGFDPDPHKLAPKLKKAMIEHLQNPPSADESNGEETDNAEVIEAITELESEEDLVAAYEQLKESHFAGLELDDVETADQLKDAMLTALAPPESEPETKVSALSKLKGKGKGKITPKTKEEKADEWDWFDPEGDMEEMYAKVEEIKGIAKLKGFAKQKLQFSCKVGMKKDEILEGIATRLNAIAEGEVATSTDETDAQLTIEMISDAVKAKDKETLVSMCEQLGIKLNALQKKSIGGMQTKLEEAISGSDKAVIEKKEIKKPVQKKLQLGTKKDKPSESKSVYQLMEELVLEGKSEDAIVKAVSPFYKEKGKSILFIKKRVKTMIPIIKLDNDME